MFGVSSVVIGHVGGGAGLPVPVRLFVAALAGFGAAVLTLLAAERRENIFIAVTHAVGVVAGGSPAEVSPRDRTLSVYAGGMVFGLVFEIFLLGYESVRPLAVIFGGVLYLADLIAAVAVVLVMYLSVISLVWPRCNSGNDTISWTGFNRAWFALSVIYGIALLAVLPAVYFMLPLPS